MNEFLVILIFMASLINIGTGFIIWKMTKSQENILDEIEIYQDAMQDMSLAIARLMEKIEQKTLIFKREAKKEGL